MNSTKTAHALSLLIVGIGLGTASTYGATYDFSYTFEHQWPNEPPPGPQSPPLTITGTLEGTPNGIYVENVTVLTMFFNGFAIRGPLFASYGGDSTAQNTPIVSFDELQCGFSFGDFGQPYRGADNVVTFGIGKFGPNSTSSAWAWALYFQDPQVPDFFAQAYDTPVNGSWSLTLVPDGGLTIAMLGTAMSGIAWMRRKI